jgi:hypothetical protein
MTTKLLMIDDLELNRRTVLGLLAGRQHAETTRHTEVPP